MQALVSLVDLLGDDRASFLNLVGSYVTPDQLVQLQSGNFDAVPLPNMLQALLLPGEQSYRAQAPNPNAGSREVFYIMDIVNCFMRGAITGVEHRATLASVLRMLLARRSDQDTSALLGKSRLRGVGGLCPYHAQGHSNETMWKAFFLLLEKRAAFMGALGNGITETVEAPDVEPLPDLDNVLTAEGWVISTCTETGDEYYHNTVTQAAQWDLPESGQQEAV